MSKQWNAPKPRKHPQLLQYYTNWSELASIRQRAKNRISAIKKGRSNLDILIPKALLDDTERIDEHYRDLLAKAAIAVNRELFDWLSSVKGCGEYCQAAKVIALIDDIEKFPTVSKLWRYAGWGLSEYWFSGNRCVAPVIGKLKVKSDGSVSLPFDGELGEYDPGTDSDVPFRPYRMEGWECRRAIDRKCTGFASPYNADLKTQTWLIGDQFRKQHTLHYHEVYLGEQERQANLNPGMSETHIRRRAVRKITKIFLQHLWVQWRTFEGLPVTEPYVAAVLGHTHIVRP